VGSVVALPDPNGGSSHPRLLRGLRPIRRPTAGNGPARRYPGWPAAGDHRTVPTFAKRSIGQGGVQLYSGSIATPTPQTFNVASPPSELHGFGVDHLGGRALHTGPYPPGSSRLRCYGASTTGSLTLHLLTLPSGPAPSGSSGTSRPCRGRLPPFPAFPRSGCPQASPGRCDDPAGTVSHLPRSAQHLVAHSSAAK
jgi:hypothetical protein